MNVRERARRNDQSAIFRTCERHNVAFDLTRISHVEWAHLYADRRRYRLDHRELGDTTNQVSKYRCAFNLGCDLIEQLQPFSAQAVFELHEACGVPTWPRQGLGVT